MVGILNMTRGHGNWRGRVHHHLTNCLHILGNKNTRKGENQLLFMYSFFYVSTWTNPINSFTTGTLPILHCDMSYILHVDVDVDQNFEILILLSMLMKIIFFSKKNVNACLIYKKLFLKAKIKLSRNKYFRYF